MTDNTNVINIPEESNNDNEIINIPESKHCLRCKKEFPYPNFIYDDDDLFCNECQDYFFQIVN